MKKSERNVKKQRVDSDGLSKLPDSLILSILGLLPMRDVVRTTILSKRWESLWTTVSCLNFDDSMKTGLVERALKSWRGVKILKFKIDLPSKDRSLSSRDVDSWVRFAMDHQVEELSIHLDSWVHLSPDHIGAWSGEAYCVPQDLYSCSLLKELSFKYCRFDIKGDVRVQWNQLKSLSIHGSGLDGKMISRILCGSPQLEIFQLALTKSNDNLIIRSTTLKRLSINTYFCDLTGSSELVIWTPNLESLEMFGIQYRKCLLMDVSSLTHATLGLYGREEEALRQIVPKIQHVERLTLVDCCIKTLVVVKKEFLTSPFPNVKLLQLNVGYVGFVRLEAVVGVLEMLAEVKTLVLNLKSISHGHRSFNVETDLPNSFLLQLRRVEVTWTNVNDTIFPLIEFLLKYASKLEKMVFRRESRITTETPRKSSFWELQRLQRMPRSSPNAELIFCEY